MPEGRSSDCKSSQYLELMGSFNAFGRISNVSLPVIEES